MLGRGNSARRELGMRPALRAGHQCAGSRPGRECRPRAPSAVQFSAAMALENSSTSRIGIPCKNSIAEGPVKHVARAGGIHTVHHEGGRVMKPPVASAPASRARPASWPQPSSRTASWIALERAERIAHAGPVRRELGARHQVIDVRQHLVEAVVNGVHVHGDGDPVARAMEAARATAGRIVPVDVQQARAGDLLRRDLVPGRGAGSRRAATAPSARPWSGR